MELVPHLWEALLSGPMEVVVEFHAPITVDAAGGRKAMAVEVGIDRPPRPGARARRQPRAANRPHADAAVGPEKGELAEAAA